MRNTESSMYVLSLFMVYTLLSLNQNSKPPHLAISTRGREAGKWDNMKKRDETAQINRLTRSGADPETRTSRG